MTDLPSIDWFEQQPRMAIQQLCEEIAWRTRGEFEVATKWPAEPIPTFRHCATKLPVQFIPGGRYTMGLSEDEEVAARKICDPLPFDPKYLRPCHQEDVAPLFVSQLPILTLQFEKWMRVDISANGVLRANLPATVEYEMANDCSRKFDARLPFEREWEYLCRAGTKTLFYWGDELPPECEIEEYVSDRFDEDLTFRANPFGLLGCFTGQWCQDLYRDAYDPDAVVHPNVRVLRGGSSDLWPWQSRCHEWVFCMSAARSRGAWPMEFMDKICGFRLVWDVDRWWT